MNRMSKWMAGALLVAAPVLARADYLYDAFRDECTTVDTTLLYSAADPVIGTVPMLPSEVDRVGSNFLVYTGFRVPDASKPTDYHGKLYGVRLFKEKAPNSNEWEFTDVTGANLFSDCGPTKACVFDAAKMLEDRTAARRIFAGVPGTENKETNGAYTLSVTEVTQLDLSNGPSRFVNLWERYAALEPIAASLPIRNTDKSWNCSNLPNSIATSNDYCPTPVPVTNPEPRSYLRKPSLAQATRVVYWLDGKAKPPLITGLDIGTALGTRLRTSRLGDIYHGSAAVVEPPGFEYKDRFYPEFREKLGKRPSMVYVGANDGMIHAFYASPDLEKIAADETPRWQPGDEAWAYLPVNMLAKTLVEVGKSTPSPRFFSQDLSCRFTDVQVDTKYETKNDCNPDGGTDDEFCGWRTLLLCGQGWGGSWYMAMDVTNPSTDPATAAPKPLWEFTHLPAGSETMGMGRGWSLPSISMIPLNDARGNPKPRWVSVFGSGLNTNMRDFIPGNGNNVTSNFKPAYRNLNLSFSGKYPEHGKGSVNDNSKFGVEDTRAFAYVLDVADGKLLKLFKTSSTGAILADGTVLDLDADGVVDVGYLSAYKGMQRMLLKDRNPANFSMCGLAGMNLKGDLTGHPTAFVYKAAPGASAFDVVLVAGAGIDSGQDPDQQANNGNDWGITAHQFKDNKGSTCPAALTYCDLAFDFNDGSRKARLMGAPLFSRQANGDDWLLYSIWTAPHHNKICDSKDEMATGSGHLLCMDVTLTVKDTTRPDVKSPRCVPCKGFAKTDADYEKNTLLYKNRIQPPSSPVSADGRVFITDPIDGLKVKDIVDSQGHEPNANSSRPQQAVPAKMLSWREVY